MFVRSLARLAIILLAFFLHDALAQDCVDYQPQEMVPLDFLTMDAYVTYDVEVEGDVAFVGTSSGIYSLDISDLENLTILGFYEQFGCINLAVHNGLICVSSQDHGIIFVNATDPTSMTHVKTYADPTYCQDVVASGDYFYVGGNHQGVFPVDATDPDDPILMPYVDVAQRVVRLTVQGNVLYTVSYDSQLVTWSLSNPAQPQVLTVAPGYYSGNANNLHVFGNYLYLSTYQSGIQVINVSNPSNPVRVAGVPLVGQTFAMAHIGDTLFAGNLPSVQALDLSTPAIPEPIGWMVSSLEVWDLEPHNGHLLGVAEGNVVFSLDVSQPACTMPLGGVSTEGSAQDVSFDDTYAFVADGDAGLTVRRISNSSAVSTTPLLGFLHSVTLAGNLAYLAMDDRGMQIADVSNPAQPVLLDAINTLGHTRNVALYTNDSGTYAMLADTEYDLLKYDVTDPNDIRPKGVHYFPGHVHDVAVIGDHVIVADNTGAVHGLDLSVLPDQPVIGQSLEVPGQPVCLHVEDSILYVGGGSWVSAVDATDPANLQLLGSVHMTDVVLDIDVVGGLAYCAQPSGMEIVNVNNPENLELLERFLSFGSPKGLGIADQRVFLCTREDGLIFMPLQCSPASAIDTESAISAGRFLKPAYPNPFNPRTTLGFDLPRSAVVQLQVFDLAGRRVRTLIDGESRAAGSHMVRWDGLDEHGREAPSGVYFYRLKAGGMKDVGRMALVR